METFDVIIVGGGMVGAALACALGNSSLQIALLESNPPDVPDLAADFALRVSALSLANQRFLNNIGVWQTLEDSARTCPCYTMQVWEQEGAKTHFDCVDIDAPALGYFVENHILQHALLQRCKAFSNVRIFAPIETQFIDIKSDKVVVQCDARRLQGRLLVGADGAQSRVRKAAHIGCHSWDYPQVALVATIKSALPQQHVTWQCFTPSGAQAFLPLAQRHASLVWYHTHEQIGTLLNLSDDDFVATVEQQFPQQLGAIETLVGRASFPLRRMHAQRYVAPRVALIGDAAHTVHPLAGQGVNMGLLDAAVLAEVLLDKKQDKDIGNSRLLRKYERWRRHDNLTLLAVTDGFYRVFSNNNPLLRLGRNSGLHLADTITPIKHQAMRVALGVAGRQPRLTLPYLS